MGRLYEKMADGTYRPVGTIYAGKSAYAIAAENGFEGTEEQWLTSLRNTSKYTVSVPITGWSSSAPYTLVLPVSGIRSNDTILIDLFLETTDTAAAVSDKQAAYNLLDKAVAGNNTITLYAWGGTPMAAFDIEVVACHV